MRKGRIWSWILCVILAGTFIYGEKIVNDINTEKLPLYVYAPKEMKRAFKRANKMAEMNKEYEIIITDDTSKANILIEMGKEFDSDYTKIAYSPFIVAYSSKDDNIDNLLKSGMLVEAFFDENYKEINFNMVIKEVIEEGKWENLGVKDMGDIKIYYPAIDTKYYTDYYDFMLVTINEGTYPKDQRELKKAMEQIKRFENSSCTEGIKDFNEKLKRTGGFMQNSLYLIPEQEVAMIASSNGKSCNVFYPTTTVYANYYIKADELGNKLVDVFDSDSALLENFYRKIKSEVYRSDLYNMLEPFSDYLYGERDVYNIIHLEKDRIRPDNAKSNGGLSTDIFEISVESDS